MFVVSPAPEKQGITFINSVHSQLAALQRRGFASEGVLARCMFVLPHVLLKVYEQVELIEQGLRQQKGTVRDESDLEQATGGA